MEEEMEGEESRMDVLLHRHTPSTIQTRLRPSCALLAPPAVPSGCYQKLSLRSHFLHHPSGGQTLCGPAGRTDARTAALRMEASGPVRD